MFSDLQKNSSLGTENLNWYFEPQDIPPVQLQKQSGAIMLQCCKNQTKPAGSSGSINSHKSRQEGRTGKLRLCPQEERRDSKFFGEGRGNTLLPPSINKQAVTLENKTPYVSY